jgi:Ca2+-binding EF-hand superfamily protein
MIFLVGSHQEKVSQAKRTNLELAELNQASEDQKIQLSKSSFKLYDSNNDGLLTSDEFDNVDFGTLPFNSIIRETMTEALIQFEQVHENGIEPNKIGITLEDYKDALKRKFEQIYGKRSE